MRSNTNDKLQFRYINIQKEIASSITDENEIPPYKILLQNLFTKKTILKIIKIGILTYKFKRFGKLVSAMREENVQKDRHYNLGFSLDFPIK